MSHRPSSRRTPGRAISRVVTVVLGLVLLLLVAPAPSPVAGAAEGQAPRDPLKVVIERLTPGEVPTHGPITVSGYVRNRSGDPWSELSVYLVTSVNPMTTPADLRKAVTSDPRTDVGDRIVEPGTFIPIPDLEPGESADFRLSVPRGKLLVSGAPGVYWLAVHVLGTGPEGRLEGADGRARTFLPLVPPHNAGTRLALGLQLRDHVVREGDGRLTFPEQWQERVAPGGRLSRLLGLGSSSGFPLTWVVDPAVLDAVRSVAEGNPTTRLQPAVEGEPSPPPPSGDATPSPDDEPSEDPATETTAPAPEAGTPAASAAAWLTRFAAATADQAVLGLPYGDLDVSAATEHGLPDLITRAFDLTGARLGDTVAGLDPVVVPPRGYLAPTVLTQLAPDVGALVGADVVSRDPESDRGSVLDREGGGRILVAPSNDAVEGARPGHVGGALAVRQRLLADAALHALSPRRDEPFVRLLPPGWDPGPEWRDAEFLRGLDVAWLSGVRLHSLLDDATTAHGPPVSPDDLDYPEEAASAVLPATTVEATQALVDEELTLDEVLDDPTALDDQLERQALEASSVWSRFHPGLAALRARAAQLRAHAWLGRIKVNGPSFVTMSSENGTFPVTLFNGLDQPVTVGLRTTVTGDGLRITTPDPVRLPPQGRYVMHLQARASDIGVHEVTLQPVSSTGTSVGETSTVSVRSSRVGAILWIAMAVGAVLLFTAIAVRIWRRILQRRRTHGPLLKRGAA